jgi:hypothetical protein
MTATLATDMTKPPHDICRQFTAICRTCQVTTLKESSFRRTPDQVRGRRRNPVPYFRTAKTQRTQLFVGRATPSIFLRAVRLSNGAPAMFAVIPAQAGIQPSLSSPLTRRTDGGQAHWSFLSSARQKILAFLSSEILLFSF